VLEWIASCDSDYGIHARNERDRGVNREEDVNLLGGFLKRQLTTSRKIQKKKEKRQTEQLSSFSFLRRLNQATDQLAFYT
jgi:hypothetical protein